LKSFAPTFSNWIPTSMDYWIASFFTIGSISDGSLFYERIF
jgi:hypothetical protein